LIDAFHQTPVQDFAYTELFKAFHRYAYLGGMPEVLARYLERKDLTALVPVYESLMTTYLNDVEKYARNEAQTHVIRHTIQQAVSAPKNPTGKKYKIINFNPVYEKVKIYRESNHKGSQGV
jgi:hypothetical protein